MELKKTFQANPDFVIRKIANEFILIPTGKTALKLHGMVALSESGQLLWNKLKQECTEEDLIEALLEEYDIDQKTARKDVLDFLDRMNQLSMLKLMESEGGD